MTLKVDMHKETTNPVRVLITEDPQQFVSWAREHAKGAFHLTFDELIKENGGKNLSEQDLIIAIKRLSESVKASQARGINLIVTKKQSLMIPATFHKLCTG